MQSFICATLVAVLFLSGCNPSTNKDKQVEKASKIHETEAHMPNMDQFFQSAFEGNIGVIRDAIRKGVDVNSLDDNKRTALMLAAYNGHEGIVRLLIEKNADVDLVDGSNRTALMFASSGPFNSTVVELLNANADMNVVDNVEHWTALMFAASEGQMVVVQTLIAKGADLSLKDIDGESAYDFALANQHPEVAEFIKSKM